MMDDLPTQREEPSILKYRSYFDEQSWCGYSSVFSEKWADRVPDQNSLSERDNAVFSVLRTVFRPEFLNRIDETIIFDPLRRDEMRSILDIQLQRIQQRLSEKNIVLVVKDSAKNFLAEKDSIRFLVLVHLNEYCNEKFSIRFHCFCSMKSQRW